MRNGLFQEVKPHLCEVRNGFAGKLHYRVPKYVLIPHVISLHVLTLCIEKYHIEHFTCSVCPVVFGQQDSYYEHEGNVYCHFHYATRFATKCVGCGVAILKQFVEINRNGRDDCWHPECYMIHKASC